MHQLTLTEDEAFVVEWALETVVPRTPEEDATRWEIHTRLAETHPYAGQAPAA